MAGRRIPSSRFRRHRGGSSPRQWREQLLAAIRDLPPGTKVPSEREFTKELGVGRSTVREALNGLAMLGIVEIRHGQGVFVTGESGRRSASRPQSRAALERGVTHEFVEARLIVEVEVARLAARRRTDEDLARLSTPPWWCRRRGCKGEIDGAGGRCRVVQRALGRGRPQRGAGRDDSVVCVTHGRARRRVSTASSGFA